MILRPWRDDDFAPYAALNADPEVRRYWPTTLSREESDAQAAAFQKHIEAYGFGFWAAEVPGVARFIGFIGLLHIGSELPFGPAVEAGWRLARAYWGCGYATEGARATLGDGFARLGLAEIVAYAVAVNTPSRRVMERIGMTHDPVDDFDRMDRKPDDPLRRHVVYRKKRDEP
ncbi:ribosomal-protein-alanine N-acetyltransferase [Roseiarcus fermentans]|uniref:Ribosomal-protein-alanine N-acetyltransferase n=2 Tax=Roseiarcus fermentans TaxID=1473586 RepID=A0A366F4W9_9HYPH|nr:ribosomal-protein-alanine N-acetyltransferase [Roseiarcus fermentans]